MITISATVRLITEHAYFFVQDGAQFSESDLETIGADFEKAVYPTVTAAFGREWTPGVDSDPRITILHADLSGAAGYFSGGDEFPRIIEPESNEREMLYVDSGALSSPGAPYNGLVGHELQHLIHWHADDDEDSWVNEGLSQVAAELISEGAAVDLFLASPDTQLTYWPAIEDSAVHYAAAELFMRYLLGRTGGRESASALLGQQADGIAGVEGYLAPFGLSFGDVFADWVVANYLDEEEGRYAHQGIEARVTPKTTIRQPGDGEGSVHQFAADYLEIEPPAGGGVFHLDGADEVSIGIPATDGAFWWSNRGDAIDSRLTHEFDLTGIDRATLRFSTWFDIEEGWDYAYVAVSTDDGLTWQAAPGGQTTAYDPVGAAYGPGYTGNSGGWVQEEIDLSAFAGRKILLRFEYVTDDATNLTGFAVDNIEIPELGYRDNANADGGWNSEGFRRIEAPLAQQFVVQVIEGGEPAQVRRVELDASNRAEIALAGPATIVVAAVTEGTTEEAGYSWALR